MINSISTFSNSQSVYNAAPSSRGTLTPNERSELTAEAYNYASTELASDIKIDLRAMGGRLAAQINPSAVHPQAVNYEANSLSYSILSQANIMSLQT